MLKGKPFGRQIGGRQWRAERLQSCGGGLFSGRGLRWRVTLAALLAAFVVLTLILPLSAHAEVAEISAERDELIDTLEEVRAAGVEIGSTAWSDIQVLQSDIGTPVSDEQEFVSTQANKDTYTHIKWTEDDLVHIDLTKTADVSLDFEVTKNSLFGYLISSIASSRETSSIFISIVNNGTGEENG